MDGDAGAADVCRQGGGKEQAGVANVCRYGHSSHGNSFANCSDTAVIAVVQVRLLGFGKPDDDGINPHFRRPLYRQ